MNFAWFTAGEPTETKAKLRLLICSFAAELPKLPCYFHFPSLVCFPYRKRARGREREPARQRQRVATAHFFNHTLLLLTLSTATRDCEIAARTSASTLSPQARARAPARPHANVFIVVKNAHAARKQNYLLIGRIQARNRPE